MSYVFDASSIYTLIRRGKMTVLRGHYTTKLAEFELGNAIWKDVVVFKKITRDEGLRVMAFVARTLKSIVITYMDNFLLSGF